MSVVRGIRGAITVERDEPDLLLDATERLLRAIVASNGFDPDDVASALFTLTPDLRSQFPAAAARRMGWTLVPLLNFTEIGVPGDASALATRSRFAIRRVSRATSRPASSSVKSRRTS